MNKFIEFLAGIVGSVLDRAFGSKPSTLLTIAGVISAVAAGLAAFPASVLPQKYQPWLIAMAGFFGALSGVLGHGSKEGPK